MCTITIVAIAFAVIMSQVYILTMPFAVAIVCCIATGVACGIIGAEVDMNRRDRNG